MTIRKRFLKEIIHRCGIDGKDDAKAFVGRCREVFGDQSDLNIYHLANAIAFKRLISLLKNRLSFASLLLLQFVLIYLL